MLKSLSLCNKVLSHLSVTGSSATEPTTERGPRPPGTTGTAPTWGEKPPWARTRPPPLWTCSVRGTTSRTSSRPPAGRGRVVTRRKVRVAVLLHVTMAVIGPSLFFSPRPLPRYRLGYLFLVCCYCCCVSVWSLCVFSVLVLFFVISPLPISPPPPHPPSFTTLLFLFSSLFPPFFIPF